MESEDANGKIFELWPKQMRAFNSHAREILYGGAAGPGKSHLLRVASIAWCLEIPGLQVALFRRNYKELIQGHMEGPTGFYVLLAELIRRKLAEIVKLEIRFKNGPNGTFEGGSRIFLNHCQYERDCLSYKSVEFHVLLIEEATEFTEFMIRFLRSRVRMPEIIRNKIPPHLKGRFPRVLYATNPGGPGHAYFKKNFVDIAPEDGEAWTAPDDDGGMIRQFVKARLNDNPSIDPLEYAKGLMGIGSPEYVSALLEGNWNVLLGGFFTEFSELKHVLPDFTPPPWWTRFRTFDWGSSAPFVVYWWAVSDGEPLFELGGRSLPRGSLVAYREWYGCNPVRTSEGIAMRNEDIAAGILIRSPAACEHRIPTLTDSLPFQDRGGKTIAETFAANGVFLLKGDTSRESGWSQFRSRLKGNPPTLYFIDSCKHAIRTIPLAQHQIAKPEDLESEEDHTLDAIRLAAMARERIQEEPKKEPDTAELKNTITFDQAIERAKRMRMKENATHW